jgi:chromosome segregation ATPase
MEAETKIEEKNLMAPHRIEAFNEVHSNIKCLNEGISTALDLSSIKKHFDDHSELLNQKQEKLLETVKKLELTKETLSEEVNYRETEELRLNQIISELRAQKSEIETRLSGHEHDVQNLQSEKEKLDSLLARMKGVLSEMHTKVKEFQQIVKAE